MESTARRLPPFLLLLFFGIATTALSCSSEDRLETARALDARGEYGEAVDVLRDAIRENPTDPETNFLYGRALVRNGQPTLATWSLRQAMGDPDWLEPAAIELAQSALVTGDFNEVVEATTRVLDQEPDHTLALLLRGQARAHWRNELEAALADAERVLELEPDMIEAYEPKILALLALERHDEATTSLAEAGERLEELEAPESSLAWHCSTTAVFHQDVGRIEEAGQQWQECLEHYGSDVGVVGKAVDFYQNRGNVERAIEVLESAYEADPLPLFRIALAHRLAAAGKVAEGEQLLREATETDDPRAAASAWVDLASYRSRLGEHGAAADAMGRAIEQLRAVEEPGPQLHFRHADVLLAAGRLAEAREIAEDLAVPAQRELILARITQEEGRPEEALAHFDEALRLWPDNAAARYYAGVAAERLGRFDRALEEYRYSMRVSVSATDARTRAARLLLAEGQPALASQALFFQRDTAPLEPEGEYLAIYLLALVSNPPQLQAELLAIGQRSPDRLPLALGHAADGAAARAGHGGALGLLVGAPGIDYTDPSASPALRALVHHAHAAGRPDVAARHVEAALRARPDAGIFHAIRGYHLSLGQADPEQVAAAYRRAVELSPNEVLGLAGLARQLEATQPNEAVALYDRAAALDAIDPGHELAAARIVRAAGRLERAARRLEALLRDHPLSREAAAELASLDVERGETSPRTLDLARRALRLRGGAEAYDLLAEVYEALGQPEQATAAASRAARLRAPADGSPSEPADPDLPGGEKEEG